MTGSGTAFTAVFEASRARLAGLAYRITGSRLDAEDIVQEAWLRARRAGPETIERPEAWLTTVVSRLALDDLRSARRRREDYVGPWLPEPVSTGSWPSAATDGVREPGGGTAGRTPPGRSPATGGASTGSPVPAAGGAPDPVAAVELVESLTFGFLRVLDTLSPVERVVFLLADVFDVPFTEIGAIVDRSPEACRQVASRARRRVRAGRVRHDRPGDAGRVVERLLGALAAGDVNQVVQLLAGDVVLTSDGGATTRAARRPVLGPHRVSRFLANLSRRAPGADVELRLVNGEPAAVVRAGGGQVLLTLIAQVDGGIVQAIHVVRNPDKLAALDLDAPLV